MGCCCVDTLFEIMVFEMVNAGEGDMIAYLFFCMVCYDSYFWRFVGWVVCFTTVSDGIAVDG